MRVLLSAIVAIACIMGVNASEPADTMPPALNAERRHIEDLKQSQRVIYFGSDTLSEQSDSIRRLIDKFYVDQYRHFQDPESPYFLMMSRDATLAMGIGGAVRMRGWYDFDGSVPYNGFIPYTIVVPDNPAVQRKLDATPAGTALFFRIIGVNKALGNFSAYIQGSFDGGTGSEFKVKKSYVTINDWTIGYTVSSFSDLAANPPVIDAKGPNGQVNNTSVLVQWRHRIRNKWWIAASLEFPKSNTMVDGVHTQQLKDWFPDVVAYGQYDWAGGTGHVRAAGLLRVMPYRDLVSERNRSCVGFGAQLSGVVPVGYSWTIYGEGVGGKGCETYINDFMVGTLDLMPDGCRRGRMYAPWCYGLTLGVKYNFTPRLFATVSGSEARLFARDGAAGSEYKYGLYGVANVIWNMSPRLQVGAEYLIGQRKNLDGATGHAMRVNLLFQFSF